MLIVAIVAVVLCSILTENSNAAGAMKENARASFSYSCNLVKGSQLLLFTFEPNFKKRGWAVVEELQKLGWKEKKLGNFAYSTDLNPNIKAIRMVTINGMLALRINGDWMVVSLQHSTGSMASPEEIAKKINNFF